VVVECVGPPEVRTATAAFATTAPEGSVTCPRKVPVVADDRAADDCDGAGAACPDIVDGMARVRIARVKTDRYFNTHPILSKYIV
jgi:hypothetical protein